MSARRNWRPSVTAAARQCRVNGCVDRYVSKDLCNRHYKRFRRTGDPEGLRPLRGRPLTHPVLAFTAGVGPTTSDGCWPWVGKVDHNGYARMTVDRRPYMAHVFSYELFVGAKLPGTQIDHVCHSQSTNCRGGRPCPHRRCVNPSHLESVAPLVNALRSQSFAGVNGRKTHCPEGHAYDEANTLIIRAKGRRPQRRCRICNTAKLAAARVRARTAA